MTTNCKILNKIQYTSFFLNNNLNDDQLYLFICFLFDFFSELRSLIRE